MKRLVVPLALAVLALTACGSGSSNRGSGSQPASGSSSSSHSYWWNAGHRFGVAATRSSGGVSSPEGSVVAGLGGPPPPGRACEGVGQLGAAQIRQMASPRTVPANEMPPPTSGLHQAEMNAWVAGCTAGMMK